MRSRAAVVAAAGAEALGEAVAEPAWAAVEAAGRGWVAAGELARAAAEPGRRRRIAVRR
jgi:hypothetical protein